MENVCQPTAVDYLESRVHSVVGSRRSNRDCVHILETAAMQNSQCGVAAVVVWIFVKLRGLDLGDPTAIFTLDSKVQCEVGWYLEPA